MKLPIWICAICLVIIVMKPACSEFNKYSKILKTERGDAARFLDAFEASERKIRAVEADDQRFLEKMDDARKEASERTLKHFRPQEDKTHE